MVPFLEVGQLVYLKEGFMPIVKINPDECQRCFTCAETCPMLIFAKKDKESIPDILDDNL